MNKILPIVTLLMALVAGLPLAEAQKPRLSPADSFFGGKARLDNLLSDSRLKLLPIEVAEAAAKQHFGVNLRDLLAVTFLAREKNGMKEEPDWIIVFRFSTPQTLSGPLMEDRLKKTFDQELGVTIYKQKWDSEPSILVASPTTFVMGPYRALQSYFTEQVEGEIGKLLVNNSLGTDISFHFDHSQGQFFWDELRSFLKDFEAPLQISDLEKLSTLIKSVEGGVNYKSNYDAIITANCASPADAAKAKQILVVALDYFEEKHLLALKNLASETSNESWKMRRIKRAQALLKYFQRIYPKYRALLTPKVEGSRLVLEVDERLKFLPVVLTTMASGPEPEFGFKMRMNSKNRMKQVLLSLIQHRSLHGEFPSIERPSRIERTTSIALMENKTPLFSVRVDLLGSLEQQNLLTSWNREKAWDSPENSKLANTQIPAYGDSTKTRLRFPVLYLDDQQEKEGRSQSGLMPIEEISGSWFTDGWRNCILLIEAPEDKAIHWANPELWVLDKDDLIGSVFGDRSEVIVGMADGSVHVIQRDKINEEALMHLLHRSDRKQVNIRDYK